MKVVALPLNLKDEPQLIEQCKQYQRRVWPEVLDCIKSIGITKMTICFLGRRLFILLLIQRIPLSLYFFIIPYIRVEQTTPFANRRCIDSQFSVKAKP